VSFEFVKEKEKEKHNNLRYSHKLIV
jgi:hypothetical protein